MARTHQREVNHTFLEYVPFVVVVLIAAHVIALVYWIYRVATEKQPLRRKSH